MSVYIAKLNASTVMMWEHITLLQANTKVFAQMFLYHAPIPIVWLKYLGKMLMSTEKHVYMKLSIAVMVVDQHFNGSN